MFTSRLALWLAAYRRKLDGLKFGRPSSTSTTLDQLTWNISCFWVGRLVWSLVYNLWLIRRWCGMHAFCRCDKAVLLNVNRSWNSRCIDLGEMCVKHVSVLLNDKAVGLVGNLTWCLSFRGCQVRENCDYLTNTNTHTTQWWNELGAYMCWLKTEV
jgi:hypothetical protein